MGFDGSPGGVELYLYDQRILELCDEFVPGDPPEYFFDKNPENFSAILELHRSHHCSHQEKKLIWEI